MKGFKKDGKFRPTGNKQKSALTKEKLRHKTNNPIHEMKKAYKKHIDDKKKEKIQKLSNEKLIEENADKHDVSVPVVKLFQKLEGNDVFVKGMTNENTARNESKYITLSNGATYNLYDDYDDMYDEAKERIESDLENEPYVFPENILENFIEINETNKNMIVQSEVEHWREMGDEDFQHDAKENAEERAEEELDDQEFKNKHEKTQKVKSLSSMYYQEELDKLIEDSVESKSSELYDDLDDPIQYFIHDQGQYGDVQELLKQGFITIDYDKAVRELIADWGIGRYLSGYDEQTHETSDGQYLVKHND